MTNIREAIEVYLESLKEWGEYPYLKLRNAR